ncbi:MAG: hypothetical protein NZL93_03690 [Chthoniobacterales bacterium]|nr:hypothetical protein [Chthoniobacterales bacterium]
MPNDFIGDEGLNKQLRAFFNDLRALVHRYRSEFDLSDIYLVTGLELVKGELVEQVRVELVNSKKLKRRKKKR